MRDRTADLFAASEALSQLSYSPELFGLSNNWPNSYQIGFQPVDLTLAESEAHSKQRLINCQLFFIKTSIYLITKASADRIMSKLLVYYLNLTHFLIFQSNKQAYKKSLITQYLLMALLLFSWSLMGE